YREADHPDTWPVGAHGCFGGRLGCVAAESADRGVGTRGVAALQRRVERLLLRQKLPDAIQQSGREKYGYIRAEEVTAPSGHGSEDSVCYRAATAGSRFSQAYFLSFLG